MNWYLKVLKQYADFNGRARRQEYWMFALINAIISVVLMALVGIAAGIGGEGGASLAILFYSLYGLYGLATFIPAIAVLVRRLHDIGKSGGWFFIGFIPLIGAIWLLVLLATDSQPGENEYGPNPKGVEAII
ncbi:DUF805 domain-containing protein [Weeksellaceae bacterium TAE3-ERU29]|nr:DUF805 domain-containing protein [Weeksellaceae bacterium TAE3-ERU29]